MNFFNDLKEKFSDTLLRLSTNIYERLPAGKITSLYWLLGATVLTEVVNAPNYTAAIIALTQLLKDLRVEVISNLLEDFRGEKTEAGRVRLLQEEAQNAPEIRKMLDRVLQEVEAVPRAIAAFNAKNPNAEVQQKFMEDLRLSLKTAKSSLKIDARVKVGKGSVVVVGKKPKAIVAKRGGVAANKIKINKLVVTAAPKSDKTSSDEQTARRLYLENMRKTCNLLPLSALADDRDPHRGAAMSLSEVYVDLNTTTPREKASRQKSHAPAEMREEQAPPLTALEVAMQHPALVLLGDPGSGKSSFTNHLLYLCAGYLLDKKKNLLPKGWPAKSIVPVKILLRELAVDLKNAGASAWIELAADVCDRKLLGVIDTHLEKQLQELKASAYDHALHAALMAGDCLVVLDGLDEVPVAERALMRSALKALRYRKGEHNRYLVTCRIRSWDPQQTLPTFHVSTLAPFTDEQVDQFIQHWYGALQEAGQFSKKQATDRIASMRDAIGERERDLVQNPLLLTTMAVVHYNDTELPRERVKLYKRATEVLLKRWQVYRAGRAGALEALGIGDRELYPALRELAYTAHSTGKGKAAADIPREQVIKILERHFAALEKPLEKAGAFLEYVDQTAGLLVGRGGVETFVYAFPHRTFQEYFAGTFLAKSPQGFERELADKLAEGDYWQLSAQLGLEDLWHNADMPPLALNAAYALCPAEPIDRKDEAKWRSVLWSAKFALAIGREQIKLDKIASGGQKYLDRLIANLVMLIEHGLLAATERAEAGSALSELGDPRPGVGDFDLAMWVPLSGGRFIMGDDKYGPPHEVELSPFKISKYPITNAQFEKFLHAGGYEDDRWWSKDGRTWRNQSKQRAPWLWEDKRWNLANHPVVGVTWFEAEAFCAWLFAQLVGSKKEIVRLPTEAEWEFAARGSAGRQYPWGDSTPTIEHANHGEVINRTTAVGSFPQGATLEKVFDLAGNVWEWCLDLYADKYYAECKKRGVVKDPCGPDSGDIRVQRGGSWASAVDRMRGAFRGGLVPDDWNGGGGFRVVLAAES